MSQMSSVGPWAKCRQRFFISLSFCIRVQILITVSRKPLIEDDEVSSPPLSQPCLPSDPPPPSQQLPSSPNEHVVVDDEVSSPPSSEPVLPSDPPPPPSEQLPGSPAEHVIDMNQDEDSGRTEERTSGFDGTEASTDKNCGNGFFFYLSKACYRPTIALLFVSAGLSFGIEMKERSPRYGWHDGAAILLTIFLLVLVPAVSNYVKERKMQNTRLGTDLSSVNEDSNEKTLMETQIGEPNSYAENLGLVVSVLIAFVVLIRLLCKKQHGNDDILPEAKGDTKTQVLIKIVEALLFRPRGGVRILAGVLAVLVIGIQHAMPYAITVSLACWNEKVISRGAKPQSLTAAVTMGVVTMICVNLTGGFVLETVEVERFFIGEDDVKNGRDFETDQDVIEAVCRGICASTHVPEISPSPVNNLRVSDWAKSRWRRSMKLSGRFSVGDYRRVLGADNNGSCVVLKKEGDDGNSGFLHLEGSASTILNSCSSYYDSKGQIHAIKDQITTFQTVIGDMEKNGLRAIAFASKKIEISDIPITMNDLHLLAIVGLKFSSRSEEIKSTVKSVKDAGVFIKFLSGEELSTAIDIAHELGIIERGLNDENFEAKGFPDLYDPAQMEEIEQIAVIGSCLPENMPLVIQSLKNKGHVVGFFGGSSETDIPALKEADVGLSNKDLSSELARNISDIVILDEHSLCNIIRSGRSFYHNVQFFSEVQLTACISGSLINLVAAACSWDSPLNMIQLFWVNLAMCVIGAQMMIMENKKILTDKPAEKTEPLVTRLAWKRILMHALYQASVLLILHLTGFATHVWKSLVFNSFTLCQIFNLFKLINIFKKQEIQALLCNYWFSLSASTVLIMQVLLVELTKGSARHEGEFWGISIIIAAVPPAAECAFRIISADHFRRSDGSGRQRWPLPYIPIWGIPVCTVFIFSVTYYFNPGRVATFR